MKSRYSLLEIFVSIAGLVFNAWMPEKWLTICKWHLLKHSCKWKWVYFDSTSFVANSAINNTLVLIQVMAWCQTWYVMSYGITRPQWCNQCAIFNKNCNTFIEKLAKPGIIWWMTEAWYQMRVRLLKSIDSWDNVGWNLFCQPLGFPILTSWWQCQVSTMMVLKSFFLNTKYITDLQQCLAPALLIKCQGPSVKITPVWYKYYVDNMKLVDPTTLQWLHNECGGISKHWCFDCLLNHLFRHRSKHQSSASLAFVRGTPSHQWIPLTKGHKCGKCFHLTWRNHHEQT